MGARLHDRRSRQIVPDTAEPAGVPALATAAGASLRSGQVFAPLLAAHARYRWCGAACALHPAGRTCAGRCSSRLPRTITSARRAHTTPNGRAPPPAWRAMRHTQWQNLASRACVQLLQARRRGHWDGPVRVRLHAPGLDARLARAAELLMHVQRHAGHGGAAGEGARGCAARPADCSKGHACCLHFARGFQRMGHSSAMRALQQARCHTGQAR